MGWDLQMASFCSLRHHPFIKQVHSAALITILHDTKGLFMNSLSALRKEISTSTEFDNYTNTTICALHHSGQNGAQAQ
ncbi:hypothetical protein FMJ29_09005 [Klebsiella michiganensis]|nr:hypothetical protein [Klebsiella michiganensis]